MQRNNSSCYFFVRSAETIRIIATIMPIHFDNRYGELNNIKDSYAHQSSLGCTGSNNYLYDFDTFFSLSMNTCQFNSFSMVLDMSTVITYCTCFELIYNQSTMTHCQILVSMFIDCWSFLLNIICCFCWLIKENTRFPNNCFITFSKIILIWRDFWSCVTYCDGCSFGGDKHKLSFSISFYVYLQLSIEHYRFPTITTTINHRTFIFVISNSCKTRFICRLFNFVSTRINELKIIWPDLYSVDVFRVFQFVEKLTRQRSQLLDVVWLNLLSISAI